MIHRESLPRTPMVLLGVAIVVSIWGCANPKSALQEARSVNTIAAYEQVVSDFPRTRQAGVARRRIAQLKLDKALAEKDRGVLTELAADVGVVRSVRSKAKAALGQMDFDALIARGDLAELQAHAKKHRSGPRRKRLLAAIDDVSFDQAKRAASIDALRAYRHKHPKGRHAKAAEIAIERLAYAAAEKTDTYEGWLGFLDRYPGGAHAAAAKKRVETLEAPRIEAIMQNLDLTTVDQWGGAPLHAAAYEGDLLLTKAVIRKGGDVNERIARTGLAPLHIAALRDHGPIVKLLLDQGADPSAADKLKTFPLDLARSGSGVATLLKGAGGRRNKVIHEPFFQTPPGGFEKYRSMANIVAMRMGSGPSYYFNRHGRSPRLFGPSGAVVFDLYARKWQPVSEEPDPYTR